MPCRRRRRPARHVARPVGARRQRETDGLLAALPELAADDTGDDGRRTHMPRARRRPLPFGARARRRRHGRGVARRARRRPDAAQRRVEAAARAVPRRPGGAHRARARDPRHTRSPAHRAPVRRRRRGRWPALPRARACRRPTHRPLLRATPTRRRCALAPVHAGGARGCACAFAAHRAPRHQAVEFARRCAGPGQAARLRHRQTAGRGPARRAANSPSKARVC